MPQILELGHLSTRSASWILMIMRCGGNGIEERRYMYILARGLRPFTFTCLSHYWHFFFNGFSIILLLPLK